MTQPKRIEGARLCLSLTRAGLKAYGNRESFTALTRALDWIGQHDPAEHFECHVRWHLEDEASKFEGKRPSNVWMVTERDLDGVFEREVQIDEATRQTGFELTFMAVTEDNLDGMAAPGWQEIASE